MRLSPSPRSNAAQTIILISVAAATVFTPLGSARARAHKSSSDPTTPVAVAHPSRSVLYWCARAHRTWNRNWNSMFRLVFMSDCECVLCCVGDKIYVRIWHRDMLMFVVVVVVVDDKTDMCVCVYECLFSHFSRLCGCVKQPSVCVAR